MKAKILQKSIVYLLMLVLFMTSVFTGDFGYAREGMDRGSKNTVDASFNLNFYTNTEERSTAGLDWKRNAESGGHTLILENFYEESRAIILPNGEKVEIVLKGDNRLKGIYMEGYYKFDLTISGEGRLDIKGLPNGGVDGDTLTIKGGAKVYTKNRVSFGASGSANSTLNVSGKGTLLDIDTTGTWSDKGTYLQEMNVTDGAELSIRAERIGAYTVTGSKINVTNGSKLKVACKYGVCVTDGKLTVDETSILETDVTSAGVVVVDTTGTKTQDEVMSLSDIPHGAEIISIPKDGKKFWTLAKKGSIVEVIGESEEPADDITGALGKMTIKKRKDLMPTLVMESGIYGEREAVPKITGNLGNAEVTYEYFTDEACTIKTTEANNGADREGGVPKNAGTYWVEASFADTEEYGAATARASFEIKKAVPTLTLSVSEKEGGELEYGKTLVLKATAKGVDGEVLQGKALFKMELSESAYSYEKEDISDGYLEVEVAKEKYKVGNNTVKAYYNPTGEEIKKNYKEGRIEVQKNIVISRGSQETFRINEVVGKKYGDEDFKLGTAGGSGNGAVSYSVPENNGVLSLEGDIATIIGVGEITLKAVKAGDENYKEAGAELKITIAKADAPEIEFPTAGELTYGQKLSESTLTGGSTEYGSFDWKEGNTLPTVENTGYEVKFTPKEEIKKNYDVSETEKKIAVKVKKADVAFVDPKAKENLSYTGQMQELIQAGVVDSAIGRFEYSLNETSGYSTEIPKGKNAGSYKVYYKVTGSDANYDYSKAKGEVTVVIAAPAEYHITVENDGTGEASADKLTAMKDEIITLKEKANNGYHFKEWKVVKGSITITGNKFKMPSGDVKVKAIFEKDSTGGESENGGGSSGNEGESSSGTGGEYLPDVAEGDLSKEKGENVSKDGNNLTEDADKNMDSSVIAEITIKSEEGKDGFAEAEIPEKALTDAIDKAKEETKKNGKNANDLSLKINVDMPKDGDKVKLSMKEKVLDNIAGGEINRLIINTHLVKMIFDKEAIFEIKKQSKGDVTVSIVPNKKISKEAKKRIGTRPVYDIMINHRGTAEISDLKDGMMTLFIPYSLQKNETMGGLYAVLVNEKGRDKRIERSIYDRNSRSVILNTNHLFTYGISYVKPKGEWKDIKNHSAKEAIEYVTSRGLMTGKDNKFSPNADVTGEMMVNALEKLARIGIKGYEVNGFDNMKNGSGLTREEAALLFENYAKATDYLFPYVREVRAYADEVEIGEDYKTAVKTMQKAGIMMSVSDDKFSPKGRLTRSEAASMLVRYHKLTIAPETAQGWALNDAGEYFYYKKGKTLRGKQVIDGIKYFFNNKGVLKTGWVKDGKHRRYYIGNILKKGWLKLKIKGREKIYYFNQKGLSEFGKWVKIKGKRYYFYYDGSLATNMEIDGYKVDGKGVGRKKSEKN